MVYCLFFNFIYCVLFLASCYDLENSQTIENEEQQQMLKRIERAKDVQIFNLEKNLIQKSHVGKHATYVQYKINICFHVCMQYAVNFM